MKIQLIDNNVLIENASIEDILNFAMNLISDAVSLCSDDITRDLLRCDILQNVMQAIKDGYKNSDLNKFENFQHTDTKMLEKLMEDFKK